MTAKSLSLSGAQRMNRNTIGTYFNMLEKAATYSSLSDTSGNIFNICESIIHINNKPEFVITQKGPKNVHVLISGDKSENITVIACCNAPLVIIFSAINKKQEFDGG